MQYHFQIILYFLVQRQKSCLNRGEKKIFDSLIFSSSHVHSGLDELVLLLPPQLLCQVFWKLNIENTQIYHQNLYLLSKLFSGKIRQCITAYLFRASLKWNICSAPTLNIYNSLWGWNKGGAGALTDAGLLQISCPPRPRPRH